MSRELTEATDALATIDALLYPFNESLERGDGTYADRNSRKHNALLSRRDAAQARVWAAQDALIAQNVECAA